MNLGSFWASRSLDKAEDGPVGSAMNDSANHFQVDVGVVAASFCVRIQCLYLHRYSGKVEKTRVRVMEGRRHSHSARGQTGSDVM